MKGRSAEVNFLEEIEEGIGLRLQSVYQEIY
jgi:hypothetical protein